MHSKCKRFRQFSSAIFNYNEKHWKKTQENVLTGQSSLFCWWFSTNRYQGTCSGHCDYITYPFPNFNGCTVEVWEWTSNFIPHRWTGSWSVCEGVTLCHGSLFTWWPFSLASWLGWIQNNIITPIDNVRAMHRGHVTDGKPINKAPVVNSLFTY